MLNNKLVLLLIILMFSSQIRAEHFYDFYFHSIDTSNYPTVRVKGAVYIGDIELGFSQLYGVITENDIESIPFQIVKKNTEGNYIYFEIIYVSSIRYAENRFLTINYDYNGFHNNGGNTFLFKENSTISDFDYLYAKKDYIETYSEIIRLCKQHFQTYNAEQLITRNNIKHISLDEIRLMRNEIYARKGYTFKDQNLQEYFENKDWYHKSATNEKIKLNDIEQKNVVFLKKIEKELKLERVSLVEQLIELKKLVSSNNSKQLKNRFDVELDDDLKTTLSYIDLKDLNWHKNEGLYSITIDNGFVIKVIDIHIDLEEIVFSYNFMSHSKIIKNLDEFTSYRSEQEYAIWWRFKFINGELVFVSTDMAG